MSKYRIAVCSSDGRMIDEHFGSSSQFLILDVDSDSVTFVEWRQTEPACSGGGHNSSASSRNIELIGDCHMLVTVRVGPPMLAKLQARGIAVNQATGTIASVVEQLRVSPARVARDPR